jgi:hypothetical protein
MFRRLNTIQPPDLECWEICNRWKSIPRPLLSDPNVTEYSFPNVKRTWTCWNQPAAWGVCLFRGSASAQFVNHCDTSSPLPEAWVVSSTLWFVLWGMGQTGVRQMEISNDQASSTPRHLASYVRTQWLFEWNLFAANPRFARGESRISFDMLKSLRRV